MGTEGASAVLSRRKCTRQAPMPVSRSPPTGPLAHIHGWRWPVCVCVGKRDWRHLDAGNVAQGSCRQAVVAILGVRDILLQQTPVTYPISIN
jgi:hypothetical protein